MSNLYLGGKWIREIKPELDVLTVIEAERIGRPYTLKRADVAREIFLWAFEQFKKAGSLKRLKSARLVFPDEAQAISEDELWDRIGARGQK
jgi:hypothetical protein